MDAVQRSVSGGGAVWRSIAAAMLVGLAGLTAGCDRLPTNPAFEERLSVREVPFVTGNTYDRQNALAIIYPAAERINVSYEFTFDEQVEIEAPGYFGGPGWIFADRQPAVPSRFVILHLSMDAPGYDPPRGETLRLGQRRFYTLDYCIADWREDGDPEIRPYLSAIEGRGYALSRDLYVRRFIPRATDSGGRRTSVVVVRDIMRDGYDCERLGDLKNPENSVLEETIGQIRKDASGTFEVMG